MKNDLQKLWNSINSPAKDKFGFKHWKNNVYLIKNSEGRVGVLLSNVDINSPFPSLIHLDIEKSKKKLLELPGKKTKILKNNIVIVAKLNRFSELLVVTIESLFNSFKDKDNYTSNDLQRALRKARELWKTEFKNRADIIGCFGELSWLRRTLDFATKEAEAIQLLESWEGEDGKRENIDFRYESTGRCIEVKCTTMSERVHSFKGLEQVTLPAHYDNGYILSCLINVDKLGESNFDIVDGINSFFILKKWTEAKKVFYKKVSNRGLMCNNDDEKFSMIIPRGMKVYDFSVVPQPISNEGIINVAWEATLEKTLCISENEEKEIFNNLF